MKALLAIAVVCVGCSGQTLRGEATDLHFSGSKMSEETKYFRISSDQQEVTVSLDRAHPMDKVPVFIAIAVSRSGESTPLSLTAGDQVMSGKQNLHLKPGEYYLQVTSSMPWTMTIHQ